MLGADEDNALVFHAFGKLGVLAQKAITRVHGLCAGLLAGGNDLVSQQITLAAGCRANVDSLVGQHHVAGVLVRFRVDSDGFDAHFLGRGDDTAGNFATVCNQDFGKHVLVLLNS